jgi:hypothetical protein
VTGAPPRATSVITRVGTISGHGCVPTAGPCIRYHAIPLRRAGGARQLATAGNVARRLVGQHPMRRDIDVRRGRPTAKARRPSTLFRTLPVARQHHPCMLPRSLHQHGELRARVLGAAQQPPVLDNHGVTPVPFSVASERDRLVKGEDAVASSGLSAAMCPGCGGSLAPEPEMTPAGLHACTRCGRKYLVHYGYAFTPDSRDRSSP